MCELTQLLNICQAERAKSPSAALLVTRLLAAAVQLGLYAIQAR
eukprot:CAMPEP_0194772166 /NCGR_PEP_ID=MMETSP0323_2-20130528/51190_1 /TAXON_ID=2866 ORGANISM="Crypthecodinium cohnii, Strain Seligo" /NCGR_SAMPLE_ID=MMETSP0323_2 /ASSEMBLY_ACC=CAM_ASM_000346 /LENGTH=43 /DNA_ID= /DNA_START= /DNA_END= /DNA_ORIENTATION=